jgi:hypothetical protein
MIVYTDHDQQPLQFTANIRGVDHFDFNSLNVAKVVGARPEPGQRGVHYLCYSALNNTWSRVGPAVSLRGRGQYMIYWNGSMPENACPGLVDFVTTALKSILGEAAG